MTRFDVRFWGVRGSIACGGADYVVYGGNTSCIEVRCADHLLIFDGGTGIRPLGDSLGGSGRLQAPIFLTHTHFDHICGLPFFQPLFDTDNAFEIWSGHLQPPHTTRDAVHTLMGAPVLPIEPDVFCADVVFRDFKPGSVITPHDGIEIATVSLNHPNGATGYRINFDGRSVCYLTDHEHLSDEADPDLTEFVRGADVLIYDASYTDAEYALRKGWGHSTWRAGLTLAAAGGVGLYVPFHHDPAHDDGAMAVIELDAVGDAAVLGVDCVAAREGMVIHPGQGVDVSG